MGERGSILNFLSAPRKSYKNTEIVALYIKARLLLKNYFKKSSVKNQTKSKENLNKQKTYYLCIEFHWKENVTLILDIFLLFLMTYSVPNARWKSSFDENQIACRSIYLLYTATYHLSTVIRNPEVIKLISQKNPDSLNNHIFQNVFYTK